MTIDVPGRSQRVSSGGPEQLYTNAPFDGIELAFSCETLESATPSLSILVHRQLAIVPMTSANLSADSVSLFLVSFVMTVCSAMAL